MSESIRTALELLFNTYYYPSLARVKARQVCLELGSTFVSISLFFISFLSVIISFTGSNVSMNQRLLCLGSISSLILAFGFFINIHDHRLLKKGKILGRMFLSGMAFMLYLLTHSF